MRHSAASSSVSGARRVWFLSELYYPEDVSTGYFVTRIAEGLADTYDVRVLCSQPTYEARGTRAPRTEERQGVLIHRCAATALTKDILPLRAINVATISLSIFVNSLWRIRGGDTVIVVTNPPALPFLTRVACAVRGARCVLLVHDVYPDLMTHAGMLRTDAFLSRAMLRCSAWLYRSVERVIVLGRDMEELIAGRIRGRRHSIVVIPNFGDIDAIVPKPRSENALLRKHALQDRFVVQFSGNMGRSHGLEHLLEAAAILAQSNVHFLFVGSGARKRWLADECSRRALTNVTILGYVAREELGESLNACDVTVVSLAAGMAGVSVPSRMYNILAAGKPIIAVADAESELSQVVREERVGWVVPPGRPDMILQAILEAQRSPELIGAMRVRARGAAERYTQLHAVAAYRTMIDTLASDVGCGVPAASVSSHR